MKRNQQVLILIVTVAVCALFLVPTLLPHVSMSQRRSRPESDPITDYSTAENALLSLEDAYRRRDIEAAVRSKDFISEARMMLKKLEAKTDTPLSSQPSDELVRKLADTLELSFRKHTTGNWPDFEGLECSVLKTEPYDENIVVATERCRFADGENSEQRVLLSRTPDGWRVLNPLD